MADPHWNRTSPNISSQLNVGIFCSQPCNRIFWNKRVTQPHLKFHIHKYNPKLTYFQLLMIFVGFSFAREHLFARHFCWIYDSSLRVIQGIICQGARYEERECRDKCRGIWRWLNAALSQLNYQEYYHTMHFWSEKYKYKYEHKYKYRGIWR